MGSPIQQGAIADSRGSDCFDCLALLLALALLVPVAALGQGRATMRLSNGVSVEAEIVRLGDRSLSYRSSGSTIAVEMAYEQIDAVVLPEPEEYTRARAAYDLGRHAEAAGLFAAIAERTADARLGHPAPGNYATLARRRQIECLRRTGDAAEVARLLPTLETARLPAAERALPAPLFAWAAAGLGDWRRVLDLAAGAEEAGLSPATAEGAELAYLAGMAHRADGNGAEALIAFGRAYGFPGGPADFVTRPAMEAALQLLETETAEPRARERRALAHLYAARHGRGALWPGAPPLALAALAEPLETGEAALVPHDGDAMPKAKAGLPGVEPVTADEMKPVRPQPKSD